MKSGDFKRLDEAERDRLYFLGDYKRPIAIGKKGDLFDMVDKSFSEIYDVFRWVRCGMMNLDVEKDPAILCNGVRALMEFDRHG